MNMTFAEAKHFLLRTGFGGTAKEINVLTRLSKQQAVQQLIKTTQSAASLKPPAWLVQPLPSPKERKAMSPAAKKAMRQQIKRHALELQNAWFDHMLHTTTPFAERMTLFWHNHFTSGLRKVRWPAFMYRQNQAWRQHALGSFREFLHAVSLNPAMMIYLDNVSNHVGKPNENFARELLELFTLGESNYTEADVKAAARAFTGWTLNRKTGEFRFARKQHDNGVKDFLGKRGNFNGNDIIEMILGRPQTARHITEKLWLEFISTEPQVEQVDHLTTVFRDSDYDLSLLMHELLLSPAFWQASNRGVLIKSPVELIVGTVRTLQIHVHDIEPITRLSRRLGQDVLNPPNVKGWPGGTAWISSDTLLARQAFSGMVMRGRDVHYVDMNKRAANKNAMTTAFSMHGDFLTELTSGDASGESIANVLLAVPPVDEISNAGDSYETLSLVLLDPVYQLK